MCAIGLQSKGRSEIVKSRITWLAFRTHALKVEKLLYSVFNLEASINQYGASLGIYLKKWKKLLQQISTAPFSLITLDAYRGHFNEF